MENTASDFIPEVFDEPDIVVLDPKLQAEIEAYWIVQKTMYREVAEKAELTDKELATIGLGGFLDNWRAGIDYATGKRIFHDGATYVVVAAHVSQAHQPPGSAGMLAVYRPIGAAEEDGSLDRPFTLVTGMEGVVGKYYLHDGATWKCLRSMLNVIESWFPGQPGMDAFWALVEAPAAPDAVAAVTDAYYLATSGIYHRLSCSYVPAGSVGMELDDVMLVNPDARPCSKCQPPAMNGEDADAG